MLVRLSAKGEVNHVTTIVTSGPRCGGRIHRFFDVPARAQEPCQQFRAATPLVWDNKVQAYTGPVYVMIGDEMLVGRAAPGLTPTTTTCDDITCQDSGGTVTFVFREGRLFDKGDTI